MILDEKIKVELKSSSAINYWRNKLDNQNLKKGDSFLVYYYQINSSNKEYRKVKLSAICDYCKCEFELCLSSAVINYFNEFNKKDSCKNCKGIRLKESNLSKYGVDNVFKITEFQEKQKETCLKIYGVESVFTNEAVKEKIKNTLLQKYGVENIMQVEEIKNKVLISSRITLSENSTVCTSRPQKYINKLFGGILNFPMDKIVLDIAFPDDKIYIEYNGGGHDLSVKIGRESIEQFNTKEIRRYKFMKSNGWKQININSPNDYLPTDEILLGELTKSYIALLIEDINHITINFSEKVNDTVYGKLRKIK